MTEDEFKGRCKKFIAELVERGVRIDSHSFWLDVYSPTAMFSLKVQLTEQPHQDNDPQPDVILE